MFFVIFAFCGGAGAPPAAPGALLALPGGLLRAPGGSPGGPSGASWDAPGALLVAPGGSWGVPWALLAALTAFLVRSRRLLGAVGASQGAPAPLHDWFLSYCVPFGSLPGSSFDKFLTFFICFHTWCR